MKSGLWKRAGVALVAGALAWISYSPAAAAPLDVTGGAPAVDPPGQLFGGLGGGGGNCFSLGGVGPIIQAKPQAVHGEIGIDALRSRRKCHAVDAEAGE